MRIPVVGGNWKCNGSKAMVSDLITGLNQKAAPKNVEVIVAPVSIHLPIVSSHLRGGYEVAAQNCSRFGDGAYTGEISAKMLKDANIPWVILGHSERRQYFGETDAVIGLKVKAALDSGLRVMPCVGETLEERESGVTMNVVAEQLQKIADNVSDWSRVVIAYEPVWAIGTGVSATPAQAQETHKQIRAWLASNCGGEVAKNVRILYGGSVKPKTAAGLIANPDIDGFLVGGASLKADAFHSICNSAAGPSSKL